MARENQYQSGLIKRIKLMPCVFEVLKNDSSYIQGIPDLTVHGFTQWAWLEVKRSADEPEQPNQRYYIEDARSKGVYAAFIFPENEVEVLDGLQRAFSV